MRTNSEYAKVYRELLSELEAIRKGNLHGDKITVSFTINWYPRRYKYRPALGTEWWLVAYAYDFYEFQTKEETLEEAVSGMISLIQRAIKNITASERTRRE